MTNRDLESTSASCSDDGKSKPAAHQLAPCLIDPSRSAPAPSAAPDSVHGPIVPSRRIAPDELVRLLHSRIRRMAEEGPGANSPDRVAYLIALGCVYLNVDYASVRELLLNAPGGAHIQQSPDPVVYARELFLDAWRARDAEVANASVMIVDAAPYDPTPARSRALSRMSVYLRPVGALSGRDGQRRLDLPVRLGAPHQGELSGEFHEAMEAFNAGAVPDRRDRRAASEAWKDALVRAVLSERGKVRHVLPIDPAVAVEIRRVQAAVRADNASGEATTSLGDQIL